jgi:Ras-related protein Rab-23
MYICFFILSFSIFHPAPTPSVRGEECRLMVWDTAGQEEFDAITKAYYRGAQVCIIVFSTVDRESFLAIERWKKKVDAEVSGVVTCVVQNKIDLIDEACMTPEEVDRVVKELKLKLLRTSVKENFNVEAVFDYLATRYLEKRRRSSRQQPKITSSVCNSETDIIPSPTVSVGNGGQSFQIRKDSPNHKIKRKKSCVVL